MKKRNILDCPIDFDRGDFLHLVSLSAGYAISCQNAMGELIIRDNGWNVDIKGGKIRFGENEFKSGVLGSESESSGTWLWAWENTEGGLPEISAAPSRRAKKALSECPEFQTGKFMLDELHTGHNLTMVSCAVSEKYVCYYRCPYTGGAAFVTVEGLPAEVFAPLSAEALLRRIMEIVSTYYCDHRLLAAGTLYMNGNDFTAEGNTITAEINGRMLCFTFEPAEGLSRLADVRFI